MATPAPESAGSLDPKQLLAASGLLAGLDDEQRAAFVELASIIHVDVPGTRIVREGEAAENFYMILAGEAEVLKRELDGDREFPVATLGAGEHFGETALFRSTKRTATICSRTPMILAMLKTREVRESPSSHAWLAGFLLELMRSDATRMDRLTKQAVGGFRAELDGNLRLVALNRVLIYVILGLSIYAATLSFTSQLVSDAQVAAVINNGLTVALGAVLIWLMSKSPYPREFFGLRFADDRKRELGEAAIVTAALIALLTGLEFVLIHTAPALAGRSLFATGSTGFVELVFVAFFVVFLPLQELCTRGILQSSLEEIFAGHPRQILYSIVLSNALFAAVHSHISPYFVLATFIPGLAWGVLYARHRSLLGVSISHVLVGIWASRVLGFGELLSSI